MAGAGNGKQVSFSVSYGISCLGAVRSTAATAEQSGDTEGRAWDTPGGAVVALGDTTQL